MAEVKPSDEVVSDDEFGEFEDFQHPEEITPEQSPKNTNTIELKQPTSENDQNQNIPGPPPNQNLTPKSSESIKDESPHSDMEKQIHSPNMQAKENYLNQNMNLSYHSFEDFEEFQEPIQESEKLEINSKNSQNTPPSINSHRSQENISQNNSSHKSSLKSEPSPKNYEIAQPIQKENHPKNEQSLLEKQNSDEIKNPEEMEIDDDFDDFQQPVHPLENIQSIKIKSPTTGIEKDDFEEFQQPSEGKVQHNNPSEGIPESSQEPPLKEENNTLEKSSSIKENSFEEDEPQSKEKNQSKKENEDEEDEFDEFQEGKLETRKMENENQEVNEFQDSSKQVQDKTIEKLPKEVEFEDDGFDDFQEPEEMVAKEHQLEKSEEFDEDDFEDFQESSKQVNAEIKEPPNENEGMDDDFNDFQESEQIKETKTEKENKIEEAKAPLQANDLNFGKLSEILLRKYPKKKSFEEALNRIEKLRSENNSESKLEETKIKDFENMFSNLQKPIFEVNAPSFHEFKDLGISSYIKNKQSLKGKKEAMIPKSFEYSFSYQIPIKYGESEKKENLFLQLKSGDLDPFSFSELDKNISHVLGLAENTYLNSQYRHFITNSILFSGRKSDLSPVSPSKGDNPPLDIQRKASTKSKNFLAKREDSSPFEEVKEANPVIIEENRDSLQNIHHQNSEDIDIISPWSPKKKKEKTSDNWGLNKDLFGIDLTVYKRTSANTKKNKPVSEQQFFNEDKKFDPEKGNGNKILEETFAKFGMNYDLIKSPEKKKERVSSIMLSPKQRVIQQILQKLPDLSFMLEKNISIPRDIFQIKMGENSTE